MPKNYHVAIVGATGAVGIELLRVMERRDFPVADLRLLASTRSAGKKLEFRGQDLPVAALDENSFAWHRSRFFQRRRWDGENNSLRSRNARERW